MARLNINIDEKWPIYSLDEPINPNAVSVVEINDDFYREYLYFTMKYQEYQERLHVIYEHQQRVISELCGYRFPEGVEPDKEYKLNRIRDDAPQEQVSAILSESNA